MKIIKELFIKYSGFALVLIFGLIATVSLLEPGLPPTHDGEYHVVRFQQFFKVLSEGTIYPRWAPDFNNGFGIPLFNYVYPLPNFVASLFHFIGFSFIDSFKLNMITATLIGSVFFYLWAKIYWGRLGGIISSVFYTFSPYHMVDIYVRGSVGEVWSLAVFPGLLWSFTKFSETGKSFYLISSSVLLALLIYSHNILATIFFLFFILYSFVLLRYSNRDGFIKNWLIITTTGLGLAAPFWLPALSETKYVGGLQIFNIEQNFPDLYQLIIPSWGYGFSGQGIQNQMSFQLGIANLIAILLSFFIFWKIKKKKLLVGFFIVSFIFVIYLMNSSSAYLWINIPLLNYFQFPWRLLSLEILISSFLAGGIFYFGLIKDKKIRIGLFLMLVTLPVALGIGYAKAPFHHKRNDHHYLSRSNFTDGTNSPGNAFNTIWLNSIPEKQEEKLKVIKGSASVFVISIKPTSYSLEINSKGESDVLVNAAFFPGWTYYINDKHFEAGNFEGKVLVKMPAGKYMVRIVFEDTLVRKLSYILAFISLLTLIYMVRMKAVIIKK